MRGDARLLVLLGMRLYVIDAAESSRLTKPSLLR